MTLVRVRIRESVKCYVSKGADSGIVVLGAFADRDVSKGADSGISKMLR